MKEKQRKSNFRDKDGVWYSADGKCLLQGNDNIQEYTVHEGVEVICSEAFFDGFIKRIHLPKTLKVIEDSAFAHSDLEEIDLPWGLQDIRCGAFYGCKNLRRVYLPMTTRWLCEHVFPTHTEIIMKE